MGVTLVPTGDDDHEGLLRADQAMYRATGAGGNLVGGRDAWTLRGTSTDH